MYYTKYLFPWCEIGPHTESKLFLLFLCACEKQKFGWEIKTYWQNQWFYYTFLTSLEYKRPREALLANPSLAPWLWALPLLARLPTFLSGALHSLLLNDLFCGRRTLGNPQSIFSSEVVVCFLERALYHCCGTDVFLGFLIIAIQL